MIHNHNKHIMTKEETEASGSGSGKTDFQVLIEAMQQLVQTQNAMTLVMGDKTTTKLIRILQNI